MAKFIIPSNLSWISSTETVGETCPNCAHEVEVLLDGTTQCPNCKHENIKPCRACQDEADSIGCPDSHGCPFPLKVA